MQITYVMTATEFKFINCVVCETAAIELLIVFIIFCYLFRIRSSKIWIPKRLWASRDVWSISTRFGRRVSLNSQQRRRKSDAARFAQNTRASGKSDAVFHERLRETNPRFIAIGTFFFSDNIPLCILIRCAEWSYFRWGSWRDGGREKHWNVFHVRTSFGAILRQGVYWIFAKQEDSRTQQVGQVRCA